MSRLHRSSAVWCFAPVESTILSVGICFWQWWSCTVASGCNWRLCMYRVWSRKFIAWCNCTPRMGCWNSVHTWVHYLNRIAKKLKAVTLIIFLFKSNWNQIMWKAYSYLNFSRRHAPCWHIAVQPKCGNRVDWANNPHAGLSVRIPWKHRLFDFGGLGWHRDGSDKTNHGDWATSSRVGPFI